MHELRFAVFGAGFWAPYQLAAWGELEGARCVALYNRTRERAEALAQRVGVPAVYDGPEELLRRERPDFIDIITSVETHAPFVRLAVEHGVPVICQKPLATTLEEAETMVASCRQAGVPLFVHENWRWQTPLRHLKRILDEGHIGRPFRARIEFNSSFPVFDNQPFLRELERFILTDMGSHILDVGRFLLGEADRLYCQTHRVHPDIAGEDVATVMLHTHAGATLTCEISYASRTERERFPETFVLIEGEEGSLELAPDHWIRLTTADGVHAQRWPPPVYSWSDPRLRPGPLQHRRLQRQPSGCPARRRPGGDHRRGQPEDGATGLRRLRIRRAGPSCGPVTLSAPPPFSGEEWARSGVRTPSSPPFAGEGLGERFRGGHL